MLPSEAFSIFCRCGAQLCIYLFTDQLNQPISEELYELSVGVIPFNIYLRLITKTIRLYTRV